MAQSKVEEHDLYVRVLPAGDSARQVRSVTLQVLQYINDNLSAIRDMGVHVRVHRVSNDQAADPRLREAFQARGIASLPALITAHGIYIGANQISKLYDQNIREYNAFARRGEAPRTEDDDGSEDELNKFYHGELRATGAEKDDDDPMADTDDMMEKFRQATAARENRPEKGREPPGAPEGRPSRREAPDKGAQREARDAAPAQTHPRDPRPDNVGLPDELDSILDTIRNNPQETGDEDDKDGSSQDARMEAYWSSKID